MAQTQLLRLLTIVVFARNVLCFTAPKSRVNNRRSSSLSAEKTATFGMGCFWAPAEDMAKVDGVIDCVAGYTGNPAADKTPSYDSVCFGRRWVEAVRVTYDDSKVSYSQLLEAFFENQVPKPQSRQYASIIFVPKNSNEEKEAQGWLNQALSDNKTREKDGLPAMFTTVETESPFYKAEGYHQNYWPKWRLRAMITIGLLTIASGALNGVLPSEAIQENVKSGANALISVGAAAAILERVLDAKVVELN
mmetsp:Transcript_3614/g.5330  ORF Transcript_3614/g.5330 Transcript_3614/m.5330 type:complete len:249 (-) Transcript_3614:213-959(-)